MLSGHAKLSSEGETPRTVPMAVVSNAKVRTDISQENKQTNYWLFVDMLQLYSISLIKLSMDFVEVTFKRFYLSWCG